MTKSLHPLLRTVGIAIVLVSAFASCNRLWSAIEPINGNGSIVTDTRSVKAFDAVEVRGGYVVILTQSGGNSSLRIETDSNLLPHITSRIDGTKLIIESDGNLHPTKEITLYISSSAFRSIVTDGSAQVHAQTPIHADDLQLQVNGSGDFDLEVHAKKLTSTVDGSGKFILRGAADSHAIDISGSGDIFADSLQSESAKVSISGSGNAALMVSRALDATVAGAGHVTYRGNVSELHTSISGSGSVEKVSH